MTEQVPEYIIDVVIEFAIIGYAKEKGLTVIPGKLWPEKPDWIAALNSLIRTGDKRELARLAATTAQGNETSLNNIKRVFETCSMENIRDRYSHVARKPDSSRADAGDAILSAMKEINRERSKRR